MTVSEQIAIDAESHVYEKIIVTSSPAPEPLVGSSPKATHDIADQRGQAYDSRQNERPSDLDVPSADSLHTSNYEPAAMDFLDNRHLPPSVSEETEFGDQRAKWENEKVPQELVDFKSGHESNFGGTPEANYVSGFVFPIFYLNSRDSRANTASEYYLT